MYTALDKGDPTDPRALHRGLRAVMASTAYTYQMHDWDRRTRFPDLIGEDWTTSAAVLSIAVVLLAGVSTPEWRKWVQRFVDSLRPPPPPTQTAVPSQIKPQVSDAYTPNFVPRLGYVGDSFPNL